MIKKAQKKEVQIRRCDLLKNYSTKISGDRVLPKCQGFKWRIVGYEDFFSSLKIIDRRKNKVKENSI